MALSRAEQQTIIRWHEETAALAFFRSRAPSSRLPASNTVPVSVFGMAIVRFGFELGADIAAARDLDDYYVFERNPDAATEAHADMVFRHLASELPAASWPTRTASGRQLASRLFTERAVFQELARAAEGVVQDLINILPMRTSTLCGASATASTAKQSWRHHDSVRAGQGVAIDSDLHDVLRRIVDEVIGSRGARSLMVPRELERDKVIQRLFDARVLHQMPRVRRQRQSGRAVQHLHARLRYPCGSARDIEAARFGPRGA